MAHGDYTGSRKAQLAQQYANEQKLAAQQMSLVSQVVTEGRNEVIDLTTEQDVENLIQYAPDPSGEGVTEVDNRENPLYQAVKFRASDTVDQITVGKDRIINLQEGQIYKAPRWIVEHLDEKSLVWH